MQHPMTPPNASGNRNVQAETARRVVEFDISGTLAELVELLHPCKKREEKIHLKLMNTEQLTHFECFRNFGLPATDVFSCVASVDLSSLSVVEKVSSTFLYGFVGVDAAELAPLCNVTEIGDFFLHRSGVTQLDLSPLQNVRTVGKSFLCAMKSLKTIDLSPLSKLACIPNKMLSECKNLTSMNLQGLKQVERIGGGFCYECTSLRHLDFSDMKSVTEIGDGFCMLCDHLESIDLSGFVNVRRIGDAFLSSCPRLKHVDLSAMENLEEVGWNFLFHHVYGEYDVDGDERVNSSLQSVNLGGLRKLKKIGWSFLEGCCNLTHVDLSAMQNLEEVGGYILSRCATLKSINMKGLSKLLTVGFCFLLNAASLEHLDLSSCVSLTRIDKWFCSGCSSLQSVNFANVEKVSEIKKPEIFFEKCPKLSTVIGLPDCIRDKLPKDHPVRKHGQRYWRMFALLIREKSRGHAYDAFQIWNVMRFVAEFL